MAIRLDKFDERVPVVAWDERAVEFGEADEDLLIPHSLTGIDPEQVDVQVLESSGPPLVYKDTSASRKPWGPGFIYLRSAIAGLKARLLLTVPLKSKQLISGGSKLLGKSVLPSAVAYTDQENTFGKSQTINESVPVLALKSGSIPGQGRLMTLSGQTSLQHNLWWDGSWHFDDTSADGLRVRLEGSSGFVFYFAAAGSTPSPAVIAQIKPDGTLDVEGDVISAGSITEHNRSAPIGEWIPYSPTWTVTSGTQPSIGNGSLTAKYMRIGKTVWVWLQLIAGSTTTFGSGGEWIFTLPLTLVNGTAGPVRMTESGVANHIGAVQFSGSTQFLIAVDEAVRVKNTVPFNWGANDQLQAAFFYETS